MKEKMVYKRIRIALAAVLSICLIFSGCGKGEKVDNAINPTVTVADGVALPQFDQEVLLCSDEAASAITGVVLPVDCGFAAYSGV